MLHKLWCLNPRLKCKHVLKSKKSKNINWLSCCPFLRWKTANILIASLSSHKWKIWPLFGHPLKISPRPAREEPRTCRGPPQSCGEDGYAEHPSAVIWRGEGRAPGQSPANTRVKLLILISSHSAGGNVSFFTQQSPAWAAPGFDCILGADVQLQGSSEILGSGKRHKTVQMIFFSRECYFLNLDRWRCWYFNPFPP